MIEKGVQPMHNQDGLDSAKLLIASKFSELDPNPLIGVKPDGEIVYSNPAGAEILLSFEETFGGLPAHIMKAVHTICDSDIKQTHSEEISINGKTFLFTLLWVEVPGQVNIYGTDITKLKMTSQEIINLAHYDSLTKVANRQYFETKLNEYLKDSQEHQSTLAILLVDLDNFKNINDSMGHPMGDKVLQSATKRMLHCLREKDLIARLGGDEFVILLHNTTIEGARVVAENINHTLSKPFHFSGFQMEISCSIGVALAPEAGCNYTDLLKHADIAMYQAKKAGKNRSLVFSNSLYQLQYQRHLTIKRDLKFASMRNELFIEYQPQFDLQTHDIFGYEALIRWNHPELGEVLPNEFIPLAEQTGLIHSIGQWIIDQAICDYTDFLLPWSKGHLSINISLPQLTDARFIDTLCDSLHTHALRHEKIILDLSEHILNTHLSDLPKSLQNLNKKGIKLSLDNVGSPQIPFPTLIEMPLDYLKFDKTFLKDITESSRQQILLKGLLELTRELDMQVIQKGIETEEQHNLLKKMGCSYGQGIYYCKPLKIPELIKFLDKS